MQEPQHWRVRPELPTPTSGSLLLPRGGLPSIPSAFEPRSLAELSDLAAAGGGSSLTAPAACEKVHNQL